MSQCPGCAYHDVDHDLLRTLEKHLVAEGICDWSGGYKPHPTNVAYQALKHLQQQGVIPSL